MKDTRNFRTKTNFIKRNNGHIDGTWEIALDLGYSAVKGFSPNAIFRFPNYARRVGEDFSFIGKTSKNSILYKNLVNGEMWIVGEVAQNLISSGETSDSEASLYGRNRYESAMFHVIAETGLGMAMTKAEFVNQSGVNTILEPGNDKIVVQTGLPEEYMEDEPDLKDALAGAHNFALKIADQPWQEFHFDLDYNEIYVMSQPKGTLLSVCIDRNGQFRPEAAEYLSSSVIVFDAGFGTLDIFPINSGVVGNGETYTNLGMKRVLQETSKEIRKQFNINVPVPAMQKALETGVIRYMDKKRFKANEYEFGDILAASSSRICEEAITSMASVLSLIDYNYLIVTGGTGAAWYNQIIDKFKDFDTMKILKGNQNDDLPFVYANVRGYYFYRFNKLAE